MASEEELKVYFNALADTTETNPNRYVFMGESEGSFTGNTKHLFLYFIKHRPDIEACYFTIKQDTFSLLKSAGLPAVFYPSPEAVDILASAGTVVVDTFDFKLAPYRPLVETSKIVQLWHGVGFKKIGLLEKEAKEIAQKSDLDFDDLYSGYDTLVTTSPFYAEEVFERSFRAGSFEILGYPRNDALFGFSTKETMLNCDMEIINRVAESRRERKIVLWAPTFRDHTGSPLPGIDFVRLHHFLDQEKMYLVIKAHRLCDLNLSGNAPYISFYENTCDVYPLMRMANAMVTDYSSIYMDYLLLDRPIVFYCPDYDEYVTHNRKFQFPYDEMTPGPKCRNQDEFEAALKLAVHGDDGFGPERQALCEKVFLHRDGKSSKRIADHLCGEMK